MLQQPTVFVWGGMGAGGILVSAFFKEGEKFGWLKIFWGKIVETF
jgi:hypothetical protein